MINSSRHWREVAEQLAVDHTVIAPDLIGHGDSATPRGDYSIGAHAAAIRDLLSALGVRQATIVGHSLGGGVAMQFFWQFPEQVERLVLISSGGLGPTVSPLLRVAALPGRLAGARDRGPAAGASARSPRSPIELERRGSEQGVYLDAVARALRPLQGEGSRRAFLQTLRGVIDARGQRVSAVDRLYLLGRGADDDRLGRARPHDPARARARRPRGDPAQPLRDPARGPRTSRTSRTPTGSPRCCATSSRPPSRIALDADDWEELIGSRTVRRRRLRAA